MFSFGTPPRLLSMLVSAVTLPSLTGIQHHRSHPHRTFPLTEVPQGPLHKRARPSGTPPRPQSAAVLGDEGALDALEMRLLRWHVANLEYGCGVELDKVCTRVCACACGYLSRGGACGRLFFPFPLCFRFRLSALPMILVGAVSCLPASAHIATPHFPEAVLGALSRSQFLLAAYERAWSPIKVDRDCRAHAMNDSCVLSSRTTAFAHALGSRRPVRFRRRARSVQDRLLPHH